MSVQQYCLRWNNHQPNFISVFSTLLHNETLVDVTLAAEGRQLQAHKVVLSACSSYFQALFTTNPCQHPIVILKDVQYNDLKTMVDFMYYGEVNVSTEQLPQILKTAEMLKIKGLAEMPDTSSVTKSESKSSDHSDPNQLGSVSDSIWGSTESQQAQYQQQQQQIQTAVQQTVQLPQRRTPSPQMLGMSPAARRKRMRKSSTGSGSVERTVEEQHGSIEGDTKILYFPHSNSMRTSNVGAQNSVNNRTLKESTSTESEQPQHDSSQESIDESHQPSIMKTEMDLQSVTQAVPLDISGSSSISSISMTQAHQQHSGGQWTLVDPNYPRFAAATTGSINIQQQQQQQQQNQHHGNVESHSLNTSTSSTSSNGNTSNNIGTSAGVQMYQTSSGTYQSQIISVNPNALVNNYPQSLSTSTSPQANDGTLVQSVYSQGPTPAQSPVGGTSINNTTICTPASAQANSSAAGHASSSGGSTVKRKRSVNPQGDENFLRALDAVRFGGIGFCKAARLYGVNNRTLWLEYKKRGYPISRPSIKSRIKLEPNMSPPPSSTPNNDDNTIENYDSLPATSISMTLPTSTAESTGTTTAQQLMCPPHAHPMNVMGFLDTRHVDFTSAAALHPISRQRYPDGTVNINPSAVNLQGLNFNSM